MSFSRVNPAGWPSNGKATSAQMNALDLDHSVAVDKTGETIPAASTITWASGSTLAIAAGGLCTISGSLQNTSGSIALGTNLVVTGAAGQVTIQSGASITLTGATTLLKTAAGGRIQLGDNDYPTFSAVRSLVRIFDLATCTYYNNGAFSPGFATSSDGVVGPASAAGTARAAIVPLFPPHDGATIASIELFFTPVAGHVGLPGTNISVTLLTRQIATGNTLPALAAYTSPVAYSPVSLADYNNTLVKSVTTTTSAVVDAVGTEYALLITDEGGANALGSTVFHQAKITYSNIADMRFV